MGFKVFKVDSAVVLAGGQAKRMGGVHKPLMSYRDRPILSYIVEALSTQVTHIWLNVNRDEELYFEYPCQVFSDLDKGYLGPLEGIYSAWQLIEGDWLLFVPGDNPNIPHDLLSKFAAAYQQNPAPLLVVDDGARLQPLYCLMHRSLVPSLAEALALNHLSVKRWIAEVPHQRVDFSRQSEAFKNLNRIEDFEQ